MLPVATNDSNNCCIRAFLNNAMTFDDKRIRPMLIVGGVCGEAKLRTKYDGEMQQWRHGL